MRWTAALTVLAAVALTTATASPTDGATERSVLGVGRITSQLHGTVVKVGHHQGEIDAVCIKVEGLEIELLGIEFHFDGGGSLALNVRENLPSGRESRWIDLPAGERRLTTVKIAYQASLDGPRIAPLVLFGRLAE